MKKLKWKKMLIGLIFFLPLAAWCQDNQISNGNKELTNQSQSSQPASNYISDSAITTKIKSNFLVDKDIKSLSISVTTENGIVNLKGQVDNEIEKTKALEIVKQVEGVKGIKDELVVKGK